MIRETEFLKSHNSLQPRSVIRGSLNAPVSYQPPPSKGGLIRGASFNPPPLWAMTAGRAPLGPDTIPAAPGRAQHPPINILTQGFEP